MEPKKEDDGKRGRCPELFRREAEMAKDSQAGYVCEDLQQHILRNEYKELQDKVQESQANSVLLNVLYNDADTAEREARGNMEKNFQYTKDLQQQMVNKQHQKCQYEDTLIDKKMQEGIVRSLADRDQREIQYKRELTEKMQKEMFIIEERDINAQIHAAGDRSTAIVAERERKMHERERQTQIIGDKLLAGTVARQKREDIRNKLQEQECLEKNAQDDAAEQLKVERYRAEAKESHTAQLKSRQHAAEVLAEQEDGFRKEAEKYMALGDEIEHEKERKKKEKNHQYSLDLKEQIEDNARRRKADKELEDHWAYHQFDSDEAWVAKTAEERKKINEQQVLSLVEYPQGGVIQHDDMPVAARPKREDMLDKLQEQENLEKNAQDDAAEQLKVERYHAEAKESHTLQLKSRQHAAEILAEQEDGFRKEAENQMALEDEIELEKERKKKEKNHQYFLDLKEQIEDNARRRKADKELEDQWAYHQFDSDEAWVAKSAEEREKINEEKMPPLVENPQGGMIQHDDMPVEGSGRNRKDSGPN